MILVSKNIKYNANIRVGSLRISRHRQFGGEDNFPLSIYTRVASIYSCSLLRDVTGIGIPRDTACDVCNCIACSRMTPAA